MDSKVSSGLLHLDNVVVDPLSLGRRCLHSAVVADALHPVASNAGVSGDEFFLGGRALCRSEEDIFYVTEVKP